MSDPREFDNVFIEQGRKRQAARLAEGFPAWLLALAKVAEPDDPAWFLAGNVVLNEECWFDYFTDGYTPEDCWREDCSYD